MHFRFRMLPFLGPFRGRKKLEPRLFQCLFGFKTNFRRAFPTSSYGRQPPLPTPTIGARPHLFSARHQGADWKGTKAKQSVADHDQADKGWEGNTYRKEGALGDRKRAREVGFELVRIGRHFGLRDALTRGWTSWIGPCDQGPLRGEGLIPPPPPPNSSTVMIPPKQLASPRIREPDKWCSFDIWSYQCYSFRSRKTLLLVDTYTRAIDRSLNRLPLIFLYLLGGSQFSRITLFAEVF